MNKKVIFGNLVAFSAIVMFGLNVPVLKFLMPTYFSATDATVWRIAVPTILLWITSLFTKREHPKFIEITQMMVYGCFGLFMFVFFYNKAIMIGSPVDVSLVLTLAPIIVTISTSIRTKTRLDKHKILGLATTMSGTTLIIILSGGESGKQSVLGIIFALIAITFYSIYLMGIRKISEKYSSITLLKWVFLSAFILSLFLADKAVWELSFYEKLDTRAWQMALFLVIFGTYTPFLLIPYSITKIGVEKVSLYQNLVPLIASTVSISIGQAALRWDQPVAALLIFLGLYIFSKAPQKREKQKI